MSFLCINLDGCRFGLMARCLDVQNKYYNIEWQSASRRICPDATLGLLPKCRFLDSDRILSCAAFSDEAMRPVSFAPRLRHRPPFVWRWHFLEISTSSERTEKIGFAFFRCIELTQLHVTATRTGEKWLREFQISPRHWLRISIQDRIHGYGAELWMSQRCFPLEFILMIRVIGKKNV